MKKTYPYILIIGSLVGLLASFILTVDTIKFIENPDVDILCNINPFISCTSVASEWQSYIFGFPNSLLGIVAFSMLFAMGIMLYFGGPDSSILDKISGQNKARKPLWLLVNLGTVFAMGFVMWFVYESVYVIGSLCLYCMITWIVTWPIFLYTTIWNFKENNFSIIKIKQDNLAGKILGLVSKNHIQILILWYVIIIFLILFQFKNFFFA